MCLPFNGIWIALLSRNYTIDAKLVITNKFKDVNKVFNNCELRYTTLNVNNHKNYQEFLWHSVDKYCNVIKNKNKTKLNNNYTASKSKAHYETIRQQSATKNNRWQQQTIIACGNNQRNGEFVHAMRSMRSIPLLFELSWSW